MTSQQSEPMSVEEAIRKLKNRKKIISLCDMEDCPELDMAIAALRREEKYRAFLELFIAWATGPDPINGNFPMVHDLADKAEKALADNPTHVRNTAR